MCLLHAEARTPEASAEGCWESGQGAKGHSMSETSTQPFLSQAPQGRLHSVPTTHWRRPMQGPGVGSSQDPETQGRRQGGADRPLGGSIGNPYGYGEKDARTLQGKK